MNLALINPDNGPGSSFDQAYLTQTQTTHGLGASVVGYVYTESGGRPLAQVKSDIDQYYTWYNVDGIFLDEGPIDCSTQSYYLSLYQYIKAKGGKAIDIINPGTTIPECFANTADIIVTFEDTYSHYASWTPAGWESGYPASKFWHIVYGTPASDLSSVVSLAQARNIGTVYLTSLTFAQNPYGAMPPSSYWNSELSLVKAALSRLKG